MDIGTKIKNARIAKGMTQEELGKILGVQKSAIAKYESGRVVNIKRSTLKKISDVLDIRPTELIYEVSQEVKVQNDILSDIILTLREDGELLDIVEKITKLDAGKRAALKPLIDAFSTTDK